jgi:hypothetical protein
MNRAKVLDILDYIALSGKAGSVKSPIHRLPPAHANDVSTLVGRHYLEKDPRRRGIRFP